MPPSSLSLGLGAGLLLFTAALLPAAAPERGFVSHSPAARWEHALVSGNGIHGAMVYGVPDKETIIINHGRLYLPLHAPLPAPETATILPEIRRDMAGGDFQKAADRVVDLANRNGYSGKHWTDPFIAACDLKIHMPHQGERRNYERSVDFATGVARVAWEEDRGRFVRDLFVSRADDVIVLSIRGPGPGTVDCDLMFQTREGTANGKFKKGVKGVTRKAADGLLTYRMDFTTTWKGGLHASEVTARVVTKGGGSSANDATLAIRDADEVLVLMRVGLPRESGMSTVEETTAALQKLPADFARLLAPHAKLHGDIFLRSKLTMEAGRARDLPTEDLIAGSKPGATDPALLEKIYDASRYNILSSSGTLMPNLQGIWTGTWSSPWSGDFTMNGNLQTALAGNLSGNMAECLEPYWRFLDDNLPAFRDNAKRLYGTRGIHVPSRASTHGYNNHFDATWPMTFWTAGAAWAAQFMYDYWLYTGDDEFLRQRALPFMKEAALFYEDFLIRGPDGKLLFSPSYSPENNPSNNPSQACVNATMDISAAIELLGNLIKVCQHLNVEKEGVARWQKLLADMPPYQINADGALKEWTTPLLEDNYAHRHCSHLYAIYPGMPDEIASDAKVREAFRVAHDKRMEIRRQEADGVSLNGRPPGEMAFGLALEGMAAASLREPEDCALILEWLANRYWGPNLFSTHNPNAIFNADICGGFPALLHRMLVDSGPGWVALLPALPADWYAGRIEGIRCRGNIELRSLVWSRDTLRAVLRSAKSQAIELGIPGEHAPRQLDLPAGKDIMVEAKRP